MEQHEILIRQCLEGDPTNAQTTFNNLMVAKITDAIADRRNDIAAQIFAEPEAVAA